jgi:hypothetical protein
LLHVRRLLNFVLAVCLLASIGSSRDGMAFEASYHPRAFAHDAEELGFSSQPNTGTVGKVQDTLAPLAIAILILSIFVSCIEYMTTRAVRLLVTNYEVIQGMLLILTLVMNMIGGAMIYLGTVGLVVTSTILDSSALDSVFILIIVVGVFARPS